jgi:cytochrome c peroxidase
MRRFALVVHALVGAAILAACGSSSDSSSSAGGGPTPATGAAPREAPTPPPLEPLPEVATDARKVALGRSLFFDTRLSGDGTLSCATCHSLDHGGAEPRRTSTGIRGQIGPINAPTVLNAGLNFVQFWDGRAADLQAQAAGPVANPVEMGATWDDVVARLSGDEALRAEFVAIYGDSGVTQANVTDAIAEYERSLVTPSRFDRFLRGEESALTEDERRGYELFTTVGCTTCHRGANVGGSMYQRMGLVRDYFAERGTPITDADLGRFNVTHDEADRHRFKVPTLRNVALTGPWFHDGSRETLDDAVRAMGRYQLGRELDADQVRLLVAFLGSLTGDLPAHARPATPGAAAGAGATAPSPTP